MTFWKIPIAKKYLKTYRNQKLKTIGTILNWGSNTTIFGSGRYEKQILNMNLYKLMRCWFVLFSNLFNSVRPLTICGKY